MARTFALNLRAFDAGTYGPFTIDGRQLGDNGARIEIERDSTGVWPLTNADPVLSVLFEGLYGAEWRPLASCTFVGGTVIDPRTSTTRLADYVNILWPQTVVDGVPVPVPPDAVRVSAEVFAPLKLSASLAWR
jgi:hypothetical protein